MGHIQGAVAESVEVFMHGFFQVQGLFKVQRSRSRYAALVQDDAQSHQNGSPLTAAVWDAEGQIITACVACDPFGETERDIALSRNAKFACLV